MSVALSVSSRVLRVAVTTLVSTSAPLAAQATGHAAHDAATRDAAPRLGEIRFPTSQRPAVHALFERGVLYLHNFHYPEAVTAFRRARALDSLDALAAAFEAFAFTHPVWDQQDTALAQMALRKLAPTRAARVAFARSVRERAWVNAIEDLYDGNAPKPVRDTAFMRAMAAIHAADPRDPEAATFYALSLLGLNQGVREPVAYAHAEAIADSVLRAWPRHPGALHYKIHAVDDPASATRGLDAARLYGGVAPDANHARHMTSHIFIALGMWDDVVKANLSTNAHQPPERRAFGHGTHWLVYGLAQQGRPHEARAWVDSMLRWHADILAGKTPATRGRLDAAGYAVSIPATWVMETEAWDDRLAHVRPDTTPFPGVIGKTRAEFLAAYAAARRAGRVMDVAGGSRTADRALADSLLARMAARHAAARASNARLNYLEDAEVLEQIVRAELLVADRKLDSAVQAYRAVAARWESIPFEFGPPAVFKPPRERAAELLLLGNRPADALRELDLADRMTPGRALTQFRRARALELLGRRDEMRATYTALAKTWHAAEPDYPWFAEARWGRGDLPSVGKGGSVETARAAVAETTTYTSGELRLRGAMWRPVGAGRHPAVVVLHGSGTGCWRASQTEWIGRMLAARGYLTFFPCRRGQGMSRDQGEAATEQLTREGLAASNAAAGARATELLTTTQLADVRAAIATARARADVDPTRVVVMGISFGGILTLLAAEADSTLRAAVAFAPAAMNWEWNAAMRERLLAGARRTRVPTMIVQAANDWSTGPSRDLPPALRAGTRDVVVKIYPAFGGDAQTGHGLFPYAPELWRDDVMAFLEPRLRARR